MVTLQEDEPPTAAPVTNSTKKYIIVKNHVREVMPTVESSSQSCNESDGENKFQKVKSKNLKQKKVKEKSPEPVPVVISNSDLEELKTVYKQCAAVMRKIESKYGHLLDPDQGDTAHNKRSKRSSTDSETDCCTCSMKTKIVFDENGEQIEKECELKNHICHKKIKRRHSDNLSSQHQAAVHIEYDQQEKTSKELPDNLQELGDILRDPNIDDVYRRAVIDKAYSIRQGYLFEMRSERQSLIEGLRKNPDEILDFKGSNISTLPGYPKDPL